MDRACPPSFLCPIAHEIMIDPVLCSDGQSYDRGTISVWLASHDTSPLTNLRLANTNLLPNIALRNSIQEWLHRTFKTIPREAIHLGRQIGSGVFKAVFEGQYQGRQVAVLRFRSGTCDTEAAVFVKLGHRPGLVRYIGMCCQPAGGEQLLMTEFAKYGSLSYFMENHEDQLSLPHKIVMMYQIALGMDALTTEGLVHRDLAARNVLVFKFDRHDALASQVKVSDFGLAVRF